MKEYSKGIYVKFKPEEVEILHDRMKEAGVQNMSAYIRKMAINGYVIIPKRHLKQLFIYMRKIQKRESELIKSVSVALRFIRSSRGLGHSPTSKNAPGIYRCTACPICEIVFGE